MNCIVGMDLDSTLASYDEVLCRVASERGLIGPQVRTNKADIRNMVRDLPNGEIEWQKLQAIVYGPRMMEARLISGVRDFCRYCWSAQIQLYIVSHKTEFSPLDETSTNLRDAARAWMTKNGFFATDGLALRPENIFFEATRNDKIHRIRELHCTHFIDDLEETFLDPEFPGAVVKILYTPSRQHVSSQGALYFQAWPDIQAYFHNESVTHRRQSRSA